MPTIALLFGLMVISAQFRLGGFYTALTRRLGAASTRRRGLLALVVVAAGGLSAVLANDIVCLAMAPRADRGLRAAAARSRSRFCSRWRARPTSARPATLIGNPQNMLIGQTLRAVVHRAICCDGGVPALLGLGVVWLVICAGRIAGAGRARRASRSMSTRRPSTAGRRPKGLVVVTAVMAAFLFTPWPREVVALAGAGVLLVSRRMASREMLGLVDWHLLVLFVGLFVVNEAIAQSGLVSGLLMMSRDGRAST